MTPEPTTSFSLRGAVDEFCPAPLRADLVAAFRAVQRLLPPDARTHPVGTPPPDPDPQHEARLATARGRLTQLVAAAQAVLRDGLREGRFHLRGVQTHPEALTSPTVIPSAWAPDLDLDLGPSVVTFHERRFIGVRAYRGPEPPPDGPGVTLALREALLHWCDPDLVEAVRVQERRHTAFEMDQVTHRIQLTPRSERQQPTETRWMLGPPDYTRLIAAWRELESDLRQKISHGQIHLRGVQTKPRRCTEPEPIPGAWGGDAVLDFAAGAIDFGEYRFTAVVCARQPFEPAASNEQAHVPSAALNTAPAAIRPEDVPGMSDETILALLEEHARRVVEGHDVRLGASLTFSLMPLIQRKLRHRASRGEMLLSLADETRWLADWIAEKAPSFHVPQAKPIENALRSDYNRLKAQANGITA